MSDISPLHPSEGLLRSVIPCRTAAWFTAPTFAQSLVTALVVALALAAIPTPPQQVKYAVERGDVTFDHAAHVARREKCRSCHGDGPVQKIALGKKKAHVMCVGCHAAERAGPKSCDACHVY